MVEVEIHDGGLYTDITPDTLGLTTQVGRWGFWIPYPVAIWSAMGSEAVDEAQAEAPVDTGFLRDHIQFNADEGGVEIVATAYYSAYQEYGTIYINGRNYFEPAVRHAVDRYLPSLQQVESLTIAIVDVLSLLGPNINGAFVLTQCILANGYIQQLINLGCTQDEVSSLQNSLNQLMNYAQQVYEIQQEQQNMQQSSMGMVEDLLMFIIQLLAQMLLTLFDNFMDLVSYDNGEARHHNRIYY